MVDEGAFRRALDYIELGRSEGTLVLGGGTRDGGYFVEPTVFDDVDPRARIAQEEIFGPVLQSSARATSNTRKAPICRYFKPSDGLEPSNPSLPSSNEAGTAGKAGK